MVAPVNVSVYVRTTLNTLPGSKKVLVLTKDKDTKLLFIICILYS